MELGSRIGLGVNVDADDRWVDLVLRDLVFVVGLRGCGVVGVGWGGKLSWGAGKSGG